MACLDDRGYFFIMSISNTHIHTSHIPIPFTIDYRAHSIVSSPVGLLALSSNRLFACFILVWHCTEWAFLSTTETALIFVAEGYSIYISSLKNIVQKTSIQCETKSADECHKEFETTLGKRTFPHFIWLLPRT